MGAKNFINRGLLFLQALVLGGLGFLMVSKQHFEALGKAFFGANPQLVDSVWVDLLVRKEATVLLLIVLLATIYNEQNAHNMKSKILLHLGTLVMLLVFAASLLYQLYPD